MTSTVGLVIWVAGALCVYSTVYERMIGDQVVPSGGGISTVYGTVYGTLGRAKWGESLLEEALCMVPWVGLLCMAPWEEWSP